MLDRIFSAHPRSLGETYLQHQRTAFAFSQVLLVAALAAAVHAVIPCLFETAASRAIAKLHQRMAGRSPAPGRTADTA